MEQKECKKYIERDAALKAMDNLLHQHFLVVPDSATQAAATAGYMDGVKDADIRLRSIPAADARPVVYGKWMAHHLGPDDFKSEYDVPYNEEDPEQWGCYCSECGLDALLNGNEKVVASDFCPYCGAKMDD